MSAETVGRVDLLERAISYTLGALHAVSPADLEAPTPCQQWDLRALLEHLADSLAALHEAVDLGDVALEPDTFDGDPPADPVTLVRVRAGQLLGGWAKASSRAEVLTVGGCPLTARVVTAVGAVELVAHGWDVYRAVGLRQQIPVPLANQLLRLAPSLTSELDRPRRFAPEVPVGPAASAPDRLVAFLGRHPDWPNASR